MPSLTRSFTDSILDVRDRGRKMRTELNERVSRLDGGLVDLDAALAQAHSNCDQQAARQQMVDAAFVLNGIIAEIEVMS